MASKMTALMDLVAQNQPKFKTHQALLVIGMQNDFLLPDGRLPVNIKKGFLERIQTLIPKFRELNGNVIWVQTLYEADRIASDPNTGEGDALVVGGLIDGDESSTEGGDEDLAHIKDAKDLPPAQSRSSKHKQRALDLLKRVSARRKTIPQEVAKATAEEDDELFLLKSERKTPACVPNTYGAEFADLIARQFELPADSVIRTTNYSAFQGTNLLMMLRARLVTELYICGCITNVSVLATVIDAARHGVKINVIQDCLGYRKRTRHDLALKRMDEFFDAYLVDSVEILTREPLVIDWPSTTLNDKKSGLKHDENSGETAAERTSLTDDARVAPRTSSPRSPTTKVLSGKQRALSLVSLAESRKTTQGSKSTVDSIVESKPGPSDNDFTDMLVKGATVPGTQGVESEQEKPTLVKTKIRMRSKEKRKKKKEQESKESASKIIEKSEESPTLVTKSAAASTASEASLSAPNSPHTSGIVKAESAANLREKASSPLSLKSVASVPALSTKGDDKDRHRLSDLSDRVRLSLLRTPKLESTEPKKSATSPKAINANAPLKLTEEKDGAPVIQTWETDTVPYIARMPVDQIPTTVASDEASIQGPSESDVTPKASASSTKASKVPSLATLPVLGPGDTIGEGDSHIIHDFFPSTLRHPTIPSQTLKDTLFVELYNEVQWQKMLHQQGEVPRLVCCQGAFGEDGSMPIYRHPSDQTLPLLHFSPKVQAVRKQAETLVGHPLNHVLIQLYRSGNDYISEHSDKTLDIVRGSTIVNVSFGAQRTMRLRSKKLPSILASDTEEKSTSDHTTASKRITQRIHLPHNSLFQLGPATNAKYLHGIMPDKRLTAERSPVERECGGMRISLTFRYIGTFIDASEKTIWGQGATAKEQRDAADVINGDALESENLIRAFSLENQSAELDWQKYYGAGSDVLHLNNIPQDTGQPMLFLSDNEVENQQISIYLAEAKIKHTTVAFTVPRQERQNGVSTKTNIMYRDSDIQHTEVYTAPSILSYLDRYYSFDTTPQGKLCTARAYGVTRVAENMLQAWQECDMGAVAACLAKLEDQLDNHAGPFIAGKRFSMADAVVWPIVNLLIGSLVAAKQDEIEAGGRGVESWRGWDMATYPCLTEYHKTTLKKKGSVRKVKEMAEELSGTAVYKDATKAKVGLEIGGNA